MSVLPALPEEMSMSPPDRTRVPYAAMIVTAMLLSSSAALAADPPPGSSSAPSKETREKMALVHEQMAACLRSDRSLTDCRNEMMQHCQGSMGAQSCQHMGMGMAPGMGGHRMMQPAPAPGPK